MSKFFCDTNSEINLDFFRSLDINLIKMPYTVDGVEHYYDLGENTDLAAFFASMKKGAVVKTQALNAFDYTEYFEPFLAAGEDIIYVSFSHKMSGTFESLGRAIQEFKQKYPERTITVVDTKNISQGAGVVVEMAARMHASGASDAEVKAAVESFRDKVRVYFTVESLEYLRRGGRLSKFKSFMGTLLSVKPIIAVNKDGSLENTETAKGRKSALKRLVEFLQQDHVDTAHSISIMHAESQEDADLLAEMVKERYPDAKIVFHLVGPVIGCHCGPGTIGIIFKQKD